MSTYEYDSFKIYILVTNVPMDGEVIQYRWLSSCTEPLKNIATEKMFFRFRRFFVENIDIAHITYFRLPVFNLF